MSLTLDISPGATPSEIHGVNPNPIHDSDALRHAPRGGRWRAALVAFCLAAWAGGAPAFAQPVFNGPATASNTGMVDASSLTFAHTTPAGTNRFLVVAVALFSVPAGSHSVCGVTYNTDHSDLHRCPQRAAGTGGGVRVELWGLIAPDTGGAFDCRDQPRGRLDALRRRRGVFHQRRSDDAPRPIRLANGTTGNNSFAIASRYQRRQRARDRRPRRFRQRVRDAAGCRGGLGPQDETMGSSYQPASRLDQRPRQRRHRGGCVADRQPYRGSSAR